MRIGNCAATVMSLKANKSDTESKTPEQEREIDFKALAHKKGFLNGRRSRNNTNNRKYKRLRVH